MSTASKFTRDGVRDYEKRRYRGLDQRIVHAREMRLLKKAFARIDRESGEPGFRTVVDVRGRLEMIGVGAESARGREVREVVRNPQLQECVARMLAGPAPFCDHATKIVPTPFTNGPSPSTAMVG